MESPEVSERHVSVSSCEDVHVATSSVDTSPVLAPRAWHGLSARKKKYDQGHKIKSRSTYKFSQPLLSVEIVKIFIRIYLAKFGESQ